MIVHNHFLLLSQNTRNAKMQGRSVTSAPTETWFVWFSEEWSGTLVDLAFADSIYGDTLVAFRDNRGGKLSAGFQVSCSVLHSLYVSLKSRCTDGYCI